MLRANRIEGLRQVIDISGDGPNNSGHHPDRMRDWAIATGIVVNGLVILNDVPDLPAESLAVNLRVASQARLQLGDPVPRRTEDRLSHAAPPRSCSALREP